MKIPVLVTAIGGVGGEVVKALRLADTDYEIHGCDVTRGVFARTLVDWFAYMPYPTESFVENAAKYCIGHDIKAVLVCHDDEIKSFYRENERLGHIQIILPSLVSIRWCHDKCRTMWFLRNEDFYCPDWIAASHLSDLREISFYPVVMKPAGGSGGSRDVVIAQDVADAMFYGRQLFDKYSEIIVQEYVGTPDDEYTVGVLCDMDGEVINSIAMRRFIRGGISNRLTVKNRTRKMDLGEDLVISSGISQGEIVDSPDITVPCENIAKRLGCRGPMNFQGRLVDNRFYVFEVNARFSASTSIRALVGFNEPDLLIRKYVLGEDIPYRFDYKKGVVLRGLQEAIL